MRNSHCQFTSILPPKYTIVSYLSENGNTDTSVAANSQNNGVRCQTPQTGSIVDFPRLVLLDLAINIISDTTIIKKKLHRKGFHTLFTVFGTVKTAPAPFLIIKIIMHLLRNTKWGNQRVRGGAKSTAGMNKGITVYAPIFKIWHTCKVGVHGTAVVFHNSRQKEFHELKNEYLLIMHKIHNE